MLALHIREMVVGAMDVGVVGSGISGLAAAWLLAQRHRVTLIEADERIGGHSHTVDVGGVSVDTGFIVYNEATYPNLTALFAHLDVSTHATDMSFAVSIDDGRLEYAGSRRGGLLAQKRNLLRPRFWSMLRDLLRFYRDAPRDIGGMGEISLDAYLDQRGYGAAFREDHLYPMAAAIWSTPAIDIGRYPAAAFVRFCANHGLLRLRGRPLWRTVVGGSASYVVRMIDAIGRENVMAGCGVHSIARDAAGVEVLMNNGEHRRFDHVVLATHADHALGLLSDADEEECRLLGAFPYLRNEAVLHSDPMLMPRRRSSWASWNYLARRTEANALLSVTYWMNALQPLGPDAPPLFVTLNPLSQPDAALTHRRIVYEHPMFDAAAMAAQAELWSLQGRRRTWFAGAYFGAGFHEDGLQAGLAVAEQLGDVRRPWNVADESGRIALGIAPPDAAIAA